MDAGYENLGFQVSVDSDSAVSRLDAIIKKLEEIERLANKTGSILGGSTTSTSSKKSLSEEEKYTKRVAKQTQLLNSEKYEELRTTEILNKEKKKEIDLGIRQKLGLEDNAKSLGKYLAKLTSVVVIARKFAHFMSGAIQESADYIENLNLFAVAYGKTYQQQLDWALGIAKAYGLANNEVLKFAGAFRELSTSLGIVNDTADLVSKTVINLGYDLAALFNTTVEQAMEKLQSGVFSGNVRPLRAYGIDISQNQIDALFETNEALKSLGVSSKNLSQSDKVIARLIIALQSGKDSFGTMAREINNLQSQFRIFQGSIANLKLAIGDLIEGPLSRLMVIANAVIIALTNVIRTFVPLTTEDETLPMTQNIQDASNAVDELQGKLAGFDKFNVLQDSGSSSNLTVTEELNRLLEEQASLYDTQLTQAMKDMKNEAVELVEELENVVAIGGIFLLVFGVSKFIQIRNSLKMITEGFALLTGGTEKLNKGLSLTNMLLVTGIIYFVYKAVQAFKEGENGAGALATIIATGLLVAWIALNKEMFKTIGIKFGKFFSTLIKDFKSLEYAAGTAIIGVSMLTTGLLIFMEGFNDMSSVEKAIGIIGALAAAITGVAIALHATHNWAKALSVGAMVAGGVLAVSGAMAQIKSDTKGYANGGYTNANLIMTHENGKREWVGKAAGSSAIVNDTQMSDIMEGAVAKGVFSAMRANSAMGTTHTTEQPIIIKIGEEEVFRAFKKTAKRHGEGLSKV